MAKLPVDVKALARVHTETALHTLSKIMTCEDSPAAARVAACIYILNRGWGQPSQAVELSGEIVTTKVIRTPVVQAEITLWQKQYAEPEMKELN